MSVSARVRRVVCTLTGTMMLVGIAAMPANAARPVPTKPYVATIAPDTVPAGAGVAFSFTLDNRSDQQQIGSVNLTAPAGFALTGESSPVATIAGNVLQIRSLSLQPMTSTTVAFDGTVPCAGSATVWSVQVKQSNDFNGPPGNDFVMVAPSDVDTPVDGACHLGFVSGAHPQDAETDATISRVDLVPTAGPVDVEVLDGDGQRVTTSTATITLAIDPDSPAPGAGAGLSGTKVVTSSAGLASFGGLSIDVHGRYALLATSPGLTSASSDEFRIWDDGALCLAGVTCTVTQAGHLMNASVTTVSETDGMLLLSIGQDTIDCGDAYRHAPQVVTLDAPGVTTDNGKVATLAIDKREVNRLPNNGTAHYQICYESDTAFVTRDGATATLGLLPDCTSQDPTAPCVLSKTKTGSGTIIIKILVPDSDPRFH